MKVRQGLQQALAANNSNEQLVAKLVQWNTDIETLLQSPPHEQLKQQGGSQDGDEPDDDDTILQQISQDLARLALSCLAQESLQLQLETKNKDMTVDEEARTILESWRKEDTDLAFLPAANNSSETFREVLRACKNWLRWYLQIYHHQATTTHYSALLLLLSKKNCVLQDFQTTAMLELYLALLDRIFAAAAAADTTTTTTSKSTLTQKEDMAQHVSQVFLYATFQPISGSDEQLKQSYDYLVQQLHLFERLLRLLLQTQTTKLALSLVRNLHNLVVSFPQAAQQMNQATVQHVVTTNTNNNLSTTNGYCLAPWWREDNYSNTTAASAAAAANDSSSVVVMTYKQVLCRILQWAVLVLSSSSESSFPGNNNNNNDDDRRAELVVEILRTFYALRMGSCLMMTNVEGNADDQQQQLVDVVLSLLRLDNSDNNNEQCYQCQLATVSLLMDASPSFGDYLVQKQVFQPLLYILERQVTTVVNSNQVDTAAAAALTPILVVLHKFCGHVTTIRQRTKDFIFPPSQEANFQALVQQEQAKHKGKAAKNMKPLDYDTAPADSLRSKMIRLLTWPQGHVKRLAGELLWTLCDGNSQEFVYRVGMGNALPLLGVKGVVQLPSQLQSSS